MPTNPQPLSNPEDSVETKFANAARRGFKNEYTGLQTTTGEDGGYLVPHEISTRIRKYREAEFNLGQLVEEKKPALVLVNTHTRKREKLRVL